MDFGNRQTGVCTTACGAPPEHPSILPTLSPLNTGLCGSLCQGLLVLWLPAGFGLPEAPAIDEGEGGKGAGRIYSSGFLPVMLPWSPLSLSKGPLL